MLHDPRVGEILVSLPNLLGTLFVMLSLKCALLFVQLSLQLLSPLEDGLELFRLTLPVGPAGFSGPGGMIRSCIHVVFASPVGAGCFVSHTGCMRSMILIILVNQGGPVAHRNSLDSVNRAYCVGRGVRSILLLVYLSSGNRRSPFLHFCCKTGVAYDDLACDGVFGLEKTRICVTCFFLKRV